MEDTDTPLHWNSMGNEIPFLQLSKEGSKLGTPVNVQLQVS